MFQLILNPIRDWNNTLYFDWIVVIAFQLILNPIRDWNNKWEKRIITKKVPINLKPY